MQERQALVSDGATEAGVFGVKQILSYSGGTRNATLCHRVPIPKAQILVQGPQTSPDSSWLNQDEHVPQEQPVRRLAGNFCGLVQKEKLGQMPHLRI